MQRRCLLSADQPAKVKQQVKQIRAQARSQEPATPNQLKLLVGMSVITAETDELAQQKLPNISVMPVQKLAWLIFQVQ